MAARYPKHGLRTLAVVSNDVAEYSEDSVESMESQLDPAGWDLPRLGGYRPGFRPELGFD